MCAVIRHYHFDKKDSTEIDRLIREQLVSCGIFTDKAGAEDQ